MLMGLQSKLFDAGTKGEEEFTNTTHVQNRQHATLVTGEVNKTKQ